MYVKVSSFGGLVTYNATKGYEHFRFQNISSVHFIHVIYSILTQKNYCGVESRENNLW